MFIKQVSIFVENKAGKMAEVLSVLGANDIDISALSVADKTDFGILRLIVSEPEKAEAMLKANDMIVKLTNVIAIGIEDKSGSLAEALDMLSKNDIEIEYLYAFTGKTSYGALVIIKADKPDEAVNILKNTHISLVEPKEIYRI